MVIISFYIVPIVMLSLNAHHKTTVLLSPAHYCLEISENIRKFSNKFLYEKKI